MDRLACLVNKVLIFKGLNVFYGCFYEHGWRETGGSVADKTRKVWLVRVSR